MAVALTVRAVHVPLKKILPKSTRNNNLNYRKKKMMPIVSSFPIRTEQNVNNRKLPILLFDIMDTIVRDPFYHDVAPFFGMSFEELIESKHPTAWIEFEEGRVDEMELARKFFKDKRSFDLEGLKNCMRRGYSYIDGIEELLCNLKENNYEMHAFTNYPIWYRLIEEKLNISTYLSWTFCSCMIGKRKPDPDFYLEVIRHLKVDPTSCIFIDDRSTAGCPVLVRDKIVRELVPFTASVLLKASKNSDDGNDMEVLLSGVAPLSDEISWLKQEAAKGNVPLFNVIVH